MVIQKAIPLAAQNVLGFSSVQRSTAKYSTIPHGVVQYNTARYITAQYSTVQYSVHIEYKQKVLVLQWGHEAAPQRGGGPHRQPQHCLP